MYWGEGSTWQTVKQRSPLQLPSHRLLGPNPASKAGRRWLPTSFTAKRIAVKACLEAENIIQGSKNIQKLERWLSG
ncbi:mCG1036174 [Mus musculus]|nr:mCG1036174 [Mus musculus]